MKIKSIDSDEFSSKQQIEYHHFHSDLFHDEQFCRMSNSSIQLTFFHTIFNQTIETCLSNQSSLHFVDSYLGSSNIFAEKFLFYNSTFNVHSWNFNSTKILIFHSSSFLRKPFQLYSLPLLTHLTIIRTNDYHLAGRFSHLAYLNLRSNQLTDQQLNRLLSQLILPDLTTLILADNSLTTISKKFPSTIRHLDLSQNQIKSLDYYSFKSLYSLNFLNLSSNSPLEIQQDTFTRIPYLEILDLSSSLPTLPFDDLFLPLQKLRYLNISRNALDTLPPLPVPYEAHYEHHLPILYVDLSSNAFDEFNWEISSTQDKYILSFNLHYNRLKTLKPPSNTTKRRGPLIELDIEHNPLQCDCHLYQLIHRTENSFAFLRYRRQYTSSPQILHLTNLTCSDTVEHRSLFELNSSTSFCAYENSSCPSQCSCRYAADLTIHYVNCSSRKLREIPRNIPQSTTHLDLSHNFITKLSSEIFARLINLREVYLHENLWRLNLAEFQSNKRLYRLTYANGSLCNRSININRSLMMEDCSLNSTNEPSMNRTSPIMPTIFIDFIDRKSLLFLLLIVILLLCILVLIGYIYRRNRQEIYYSNDPMVKPTRPYNDYSYTDDEDYASIPLTISQTDLTIPVLHCSSKVTATTAPPLPPPRPVSHTSTTSTSITIHSNILPPIHTQSYLQFKFDVLLLYSREDSDYIHRTIAPALDEFYGKRFTFYFIHRDRLLGEIDWLIDNSSITIFILRKPYDHLQHYTKYCLAKKCFIILINSQMISLKIREKIARFYHTSNIYEWNTNPNALIHEQLELFLEQNCRS